MVEVIISREKQYQRRGFTQWKWLYSVNGVTIGTRLDSAEAWAKRNFPGAVIKRGW